MSENENNEIDLKDLLKAILDTRSWVVVVLLLLTVAYWGLQTAKNIVVPTVHSYSTRINLVFEGVAEGEYPNETPFSINDIISPAVLGSLYDENGMESYINRKDFVSAFSVEPYTPDREFILQKYQTLMANKKLSGAEIEGLRINMNGELQKAAKDSVRVQFTSNQADSIPVDLISKILLDVPSTWATHMVEDLGVLRFETKIYSDKVVDRELYESTDYLIAFEMLLGRLKLLQNNIDAIKELPNGVSATDDESGLNIADLENAVEDVRRYHLTPLINPVRYLGIAKNPELVQLYFENELRDLRRSRELLSNKKQNIIDTYNSYANNRMQESDVASIEGGSLSTGGLIPQIGEDFITKIVELTNAGADIVYRQDLNTKMLEVSDDLSDFNQEVTRITEILSSLQDVEGATSKTQTLRETYELQVTENMPAILDLLVKYFQVSNRIYDKLSMERLGATGYLYQLADGEVDHNSSGSILNMANFRMYLILCFLAVVAVVPIVMIRNALNE